MDTSSNIFEDHTTMSEDYGEGPQRVADPGTSSVICLSDDNTSDSEVDHSVHGQPTVEPGDMESAMTLQRNDFLQHYNHLTNSLNAYKDEWTNIEKEIEVTRIEYVAKLKKLHNKQRRLKKKIAKFKRPKRQDPLKQAFESSYYCPSCQSHIPGKMVLHFECSHVVCVLCYIKLKSVECTLCQKNIWNVCKFKQVGERYVVQHLTRDVILKSASNVTGDLAQMIALSSHR